METKENNSNINDEITGFSGFELSPGFIEGLTKRGITEPTLIQKRSIPHILKRKDVIGESATGSGKTIAFGCGVVENVKPGQGLQAIVLTPTRELAEQVKTALGKLTRNLKIISVYGGVAINPQIEGLRRAEVMVATPGRTLDHLERGTIDMSKIRLVVLDEADRMLDMGFIDDVEQIIRSCPRKRQTLFFSATISPRIQELARKHMFQPIKVTATAMVDPKKLTQVYYDVPRNQKLSLLVYLFNAKPSGLIMIFCNTRRTVEFVAKNLKANKIDAIAIHGGMTQNKRTKTIELFNNAKVSVLVCTDVAARGLHIDNVSHVYNYEIPADATDYVHRIGRTARAGQRGDVVNMLCDFDYENFSRIQTTHRDYNIVKVDTPNTPRIVAIKASIDRSRSAPRRRNNFPKRNFRRR
jgi:superfamily II DNA/RNA helicase